MAQIKIQEKARRPWWPWLLLLIPLAWVLMRSRSEGNVADRQAASDSSASVMTPVGTGSGATVGADTSAATGTGTGAAGTTGTPAGAATGTPATPAPATGTPGTSTPGSAESTP
jgi:hypothetical protein